MAGQPLRVHKTLCFFGPASTVCAVAMHLLVWGGGMVLGPVSVLAAPALCLLLPSWQALCFAALVAALMVLPQLPESAYVNRAFLQTAALLTGGSTLWVADEVVPHLGDGTMVCFHPHGIIPLGFSLNGATRAKARNVKAYLPDEAPIDARVSGVQAPVLFRIPLLRQILHLFGCTMPATKAGMCSLFAKKTTFGIIVGGSEEVALHIRGRERLYLQGRAGFLKYALQYGYKVVVAYNFGESDLYESASFLRPLNMWLVKTFGFVLPVFWGRWWCPILPRAGVPLNTVYGAVLELPRIEDPTPEQVAEWHKKYIATVQEVFESHKDRFGYKSRCLEIL